MTRERAEARYAFSLRREYVKSRILIPKYYDPELDEQLRDQEASDNLPWIRLDDLIASGALTLTSGIEVGKMAYGTGDIPFIRTSDMVDGQIRRDVRQGVSERLYRAVASRASVAAGDVLMVRDGTYLVGSSAIVTADDVPAIICGGLLRFRSLRPRQLSPYWLLGVLNFPIVRKQLRARQFTRDVIDTLGDRVREVRVPNPSSERARTLAEQMAEMVDRQKRAKAQMSVVIQDVEPEPPALLNGRPAWSMR
jgi:hypothetical protein